MRERFFFVYLLASKRNGTLYLGVTHDLRARVEAHKAGKGSAFTRKYGVDQLVWFEVFGELGAARQREKTMKCWKRAWKIALIEAANPDWRDLSADLDPLM